MPDNDENPIPRSEAWQYDPEYWTDYKYDEGRWTKKSESEQDDEEDVCSIIDENQNKGKIDELPDSCSGKYIFDISKKSTRNALARVWSNEETKNEVIQGLRKIDEGTLLPRNTKDFKNFVGLKEHKYGNVRMLYEPSKKGKPEKIVAIFIKKDLDLVKKGLRSDYPTKRK